MHFSLVLVQLDLVNLIPSFRLPGSGRAYACYCLLDDRVGVGLGVQPGWVVGYHEHRELSVLEAERAEHLFVFVKRLPEQSEDGCRLVVKHAVLWFHG